MRIIVSVIVIAVSVFMVLLVEMNLDKITINITPSKTYEVSKSFFFLLSLLIGAGVVFTGYLYRDIRRFLNGMKAQRDLKKQSKIQELYTKGLNSLLAKRTPEATTYFQKVLTINSNHVDTLLRLGISQLRQKNFSEAIRLHQKALSLDSSNQEVMFSLAADYEEAKRYDDAIKMYKDILSKDQTNLTALIKLRDMYHAMNRWEDLYEAQRQLLSNALAPSDQEVEQRKLVGFKYEFGRSLLEIGDLERAKKLFRGVIKLDRDFIPAYLGLGEVYVEEGKPSDAGDLWEKAYKMTSSIVLLHRLEDFHLKQGEPNRAIDLYSQALSKEPQNSTLKFFLGKLYYRLEMIDEAFDILSTVDWGDRELPDVHKLLGNIYLRRGSLGLAATEFKKALGFRKQVLIPYVCSNCEHKTMEWTGRCQNCGKWNTFGVNLEKTC